MLIVVVAVLLMEATNGACTFRAPFPFPGTFQGFQSSVFGLQQFNVSGMMMYLNSPDQQQALCEGRLENASVMMVGFVLPQIVTRQPNLVLPGGCSLELMAKNCARASCAGLVQFGFDAPPDSRFDLTVRDWWDRFNGTGYTFPVMQCLMPPAVFSQLLLGNVTIPPSVVLLSDGLSGYDVLAQSYGIFFQVFFSVWSLFLVLSAALFIWGQVVASREGGKRFPEVAIVTLSFELLCNLMRFIYCVVDPLWKNGLYPVQIHMVFVTGFFSFSLIATLALALFWWMSLSTSRATKVRLRDCGPLSFLVGGSLIALAGEFIPAGLRLGFANINLTGLSLEISGGFALGSYLLLSGFFLISGVRVVYTLNRGRAMRTDGAAMPRLQQRLLYFVVADSLSMITCGGLFLLVTSPWFLTNAGFWACFSVIWVFLCLISTLQVYTFRALPPKPVRQQVKADGGYGGTGGQTADTSEVQTGFLVV